MTRKKTGAQLDEEIAASLAAGAARSLHDKYRRAAAIVDGRIVRDGIPNRSSIGAELSHYEVLPGVR